MSQISEGWPCFAGRYCEKPFATAPPLRAPEILLCFPAGENAHDIHGENSNRTSTAHAQGIRTAPSTTMQPQRR